MTRRVSPADRMRDAIALVVLLGGAALYLYAYAGLRALAIDPTVPKGEWSLARFNSYHQYSNAGAVLIGLGVVAVAWSFWRHRRGVDQSA